MRWVLALPGRGTSRTSNKNRCDRTLFHLGSLRSGKAGIRSHGEPAYATLGAEDGGTRVTLRYEDWYRAALRRAFEHKGLGDLTSRLAINTRLQ
jgi:hypothetical protein